MNFPIKFLGDLTEHLSSGISRPFYDRPEGRPVLRSTNVKDGVLSLDEIKYWHAKDPRGANLDVVSPRPGDMLVNFVNGSSKELGKAAMFRGQPEGCIVTTNFFIVRFDPTKVDSEFANYFFQSNLYRKWLHETAGFSGQGSFNKADFSRLGLPCPDLSAQRKIAEILRTWDEALEKLTALRAAKQRRHRALTISLVFGGNRLDRFHVSDEVQPHRWFSLPTSWGCKPIGKLAREVSERNANGTQHEVLSCSKYDGFVRSLEYFKKQVFSTDLSGYKKIWRGDFGFPSNHVEEGSIGIQNLADVGVVSPIYTVFRFDPDHVDGDYAYAVLKTGLYRHIFEVSTSASVDRRGSLRWSEFSKIPFPVPTLVEQKAIAEILRTSQADIDGLTAEIEALTRQKRGLMQKLLTGEWRVDAGASSQSTNNQETTYAE